MKVVFHPDYLSVYTMDPAAEAGRLESVLQVIEPHVEFITPEPADLNSIKAVHSIRHIESVKSEGLLEISLLAAGGAIKAAEIGLKEPCFGLIRPPGHHASMDGYWGFCYFNNMAVAVNYIRRVHGVRQFFILDFDLHYGDGTANIFSGDPDIRILNPSGRDRREYLAQVESALKGIKVEMLCVSAGFDNHERDWGGLLKTEDYYTMGRMVYEKAKELGAGSFGILEGGYNHQVLGQNVFAFLKGLNGLGP